MKKCQILFCCILLYLLHGCTTKQPDTSLPEQKPAGKILSDEELYTLLSETIMQKELLVSLTDQKGLYSFAALPDELGISILNQEKEINLNFYRREPDRDGFRFAVPAILFTFMNGEAKEEGVIDLLVEKEDIAISLNTYDIRDVSLIYKDGKIMMGYYNMDPTIRDIEDISQPLMAAVTATVTRVLNEYAADLQALEHAFQVLHETIMTTDSRFLRKDFSVWQSDAADHERIYKAMQEESGKVCTYQSRAYPVEEEPYYSSAGILDRDAAEFTRPQDAVITPQIAGNILLKSELYSIREDIYISSYTWKPVEGFQGPKVHGFEYETIAFYDRYADLQQQFLPGSAPFVLSQEIELPGGYQLIEEYPEQGVIVLSSGMFDYSNPHSMSIWLKDYKKQNGMIDAEFVYYETKNSFLKDQAQNTYWYSNCLESSLHQNNILKKYVNRFSQRNVIMIDRGNRYPEIVSYTRLN